MSFFHDATFFFFSLFVSYASSGPPAKLGNSSTVVDKWP